MAAIIRLSAVAVGRLRAQVRPAFGRPAEGHFEGRVGAERVAVVGVRVAGRDQQHAEADHLGQGVGHPLRRPRVLDAACQALRDPESAIDVRQHNHACVRGQATAVEGGLHHLAGDRRREGAPLVLFHGALRGGSH